MRLDDVARDGEAEARALALGREERVEDARADVLGDAAAAVVDVDDDAHPLGRDAHLDGAAVGHRLARVAQQVEQRLAQLRLVEERRAAGPARRASVDGAPRQLDLGPREVHDLAHRGGHVVGLHARLRQARDAQVLLAQVLEALHLALDGREQVLHLGAAASPSLAGAPPRAARR